MLKKNNQLFFPPVKSHKDSPKSGSDADVFVDVESIDDRSYASLVGQQRGVVSKGSRVDDDDYDVIEEDESNVEMGEYESDVNVYNEEFWECGDESMFNEMKTLMEVMWILQILIN